MIYWYTLIRWMSIGSMSERYYNASRRWAYMPIPRNALSTWIQWSTSGTFCPQRDYLWTQPKLQQSKHGQNPVMSEKYNPFWASPTFINNLSAIMWNPHSPSQTSARKTPPGTLVKQSPLLFNT